MNNAHPSTHEFLYAANASAKATHEDLRKAVRPMLLLLARLSGDAEGIQAGIHAANEDEEREDVRGHFYQARDEQKTTARLALAASEALRSLAEHTRKVEDHLAAIEKVASVPLTPAATTSG